MRDGEARVRREKMEEMATLKNKNWKCNLAHFI